MSIGKIGEFNVHSDNWKLYVERLEQFFVVNDIKSELQVPTLITVVGAECYELLVNLCTPKRPSTFKSFKELTQILEKHLQPKPSILAERYKFRHRKQQPNESIADYVTILKKMSSSCEFKNNLEENLRDQFVCNITSDLIRQRLFAEDDLDFGKAYKLAVSLEAAEKDAAAVVQDQGGAVAGAYSVGCRPMANARHSAASEPWLARSAGAANGTHGGGGGGGRRSAPRAPRRTAKPATTVEQTRQQQECKSCGGQHDSATCRFSSYVCRVCNKQGHLGRVCPHLTKHYSVAMAENSRVDDEDSDEVIIDINRLSVSQCKPIIIPINVHGHNITMECDTGSAVSCISYELYRKLFSDLEIKPCKLILRYYTGELIRPIGMIQPMVKYKDKTKTLDLYVIQNGKTILLGRQWLAELNIALYPLEYEALHNVGIKENFNWKEFSSRYSDVFADGLGRFTGGPVSIHVREGARPVFMRARPLAYALREPVERALEQLVRDDILTPVDRSDWATPIAPVVKKDGSIRLCADYKLTLNKVLEVDRYQLPKVEDLLARLHGGKRFSKIDLSQAYAQFVLDDSREYTVINTHKGLFRYNRLVYGLSSSPGIFQRHLEQLFADLPFVGVFLDDVVITGRDSEQHLDNLYKVFDRLKNNGLRVRKEKCTFFAESIEYLGHVISETGVHTCGDKVEAIVSTPTPTNVSELRAFIGLVMYYAKFIKNVSTILAPLYTLLRANVKYEWSAECAASFEAVKRALSSSEVLMHYSLELPLVLTADASGVGVGAVISHLTPAGERPIAYASRTLSAAERAYAQIDREALAIVFGVRKFHQYLYGRKFVLRTDHKPLTYIFGSKVGIPVMAASRIQRWAVLLSGYSYDIEYVASKKNCADALSRLPIRSSSERTVIEERTYLNFAENFLPVTNNDVKGRTSQDAVLSRVMAYTQSGWPLSCPDEELRPYFIRRNELYIERGCLMWGYRIVIPAALRSSVLKQLHVSHMGIVKTKSLARSYVWWPDIDANVEETCRQCETCAAEAPAPPRAPPTPWPYTSMPWSRLHVDFLGPLANKTFLIVIDSSTKWLEVFEMTRTNASAVIKVLRATFARFGLPTEVVSDQGPPFTSGEFREFLQNNGIRQSFSPAYHPASNGAAENAVKLCKRAIKKALRDSIDVDTAVQTFLLAYRNSIHSTTGETPAMLLQRRGLRSRLDLLRGARALEEHVRDAQRRQVQAAGGVPRHFAEGDAVWARDYGARDKWTKGTVVTAQGENRFTLGADDGRLLTRHVDQMRGRSRRSSVIYPSADGDIINHGSEDVVTQQPGVQVTNDGQREESNVVSEKSAAERHPTGIHSPLHPPETPGPSRERSKRTRRPVLRYGFEID